MNNRPSFQFYPADWRKDYQLQLCSMEAQGVWINLICIMHESPKYGYLVCQNGDEFRSIESEIYKILGISKQKSRKIVEELLEKNVIKRDEKFQLFCKRMVHDENIRNIRAEAGKKGGNPKLKSSNNSKKQQDLLNQNGNQSPTPSSSSSSSSSNTTLSTTQGSKLRIPSSHDNKEFRDAWANWTTHRKEIKKKLTPSTAAKQISKLTSVDAKTAIAMINQSIENGWTGLFDVKKQPKQKSNESFVHTPNSRIINDPRYTEE